MGIVFQFMLAKINSLKATQKAIMKSLSFVHGEVLKVKKNKKVLVTLFISIIESLELVPA